MKYKSPCRVCLTPVFNITKRHDEVLGGICAECRKFSAYADAALRKHGIEGTDPAPVRFLPSPEKP